MAIQISVETLSPITHNQIPVITTELLAQLYGTETNNIKVNYTRNAERFVCGKHYFKLEGAELREFKNKVTQSNLVAPRTKHLILWTERGVKWSTKTGHRVRVFSSIDFPIRLVVTHHYIRAVLVRCNIQRYSPLLRELHR